VHILIPSIHSISSIRSQMQSAMLLLLTRFPPLLFVCYM